MIKHIGNGVLTEEYNPNKHLNIINTDNTRYFKSLLYDIELIYLEKIIDTKNYKIYDINISSSGCKYVYVKVENVLNVLCVSIPKLDVLYTRAPHFAFRHVYTWKSKKGTIHEKYTSYILYNRNANRYYQVGDINKYGWKLINIHKEMVNDYSYRKPSYVSLKFN